MATTVARRIQPRAAGKTSSGFRGAEGRAKMIEETRRQEAQREMSAMNAHMPYRFRMKTGESKEVIIVDSDPDNTFFRWEHNLKDKRSGMYSIFCACIQEDANCPVCKATDRPSYFGMFLTVIDLTPYTDKDGNEVLWSKKLMCVKINQQKKFNRMFEKYGTLRGLVLRMTRDGDKDASIGNDIEEDGFVEEEELLAYETSYTDKKGKVHDVIGHEVFDYDELFPAVTEQHLRAIVGGVAEPGSREDDNAAIGRTRTHAPRGSTNDDWEENAPPARAASSRAPTRSPAPATRPAPTVRRKVVEEVEEVEEDLPEEEALPLTRRAVAPARPAAAARRPARVIEEGEEEELEFADSEVEEEPPARPTARPAARREAPPPATRAAPARRAALPDPEEDEPQRPKTSASSLADRRRLLRR